MTIFSNRTEAGQKLAKELLEYKDKENVIIFALPRGGVPVGLEITKELNATLDVFLVRKLGVPGQKELAMGAIASGDITAMNNEVVNMLNISDDSLNEVIEKEKEELKRRETVYRGDRKFPDVKGTVVILVDDGIATGASMKAAVKAIKTSEPAKVIVAVPTAPKQSCGELESMADQTICLSTPEPFRAIGLWYEEFSQLDDDDVRNLLEQAQKF